MARKGTTKRRAVEYDFTAFEEYIPKIQALGVSDKEIVAAYDKAYKYGFQYARETVRDWFDKPSTGRFAHRRTGTTASALVDGKTTVRGGLIVHTYGYDVDRAGGRNAIYFEYGTPRIPPEFVIYYSIKDNADYAYDRMVDSLVEFLKSKGFEPKSGGAS